jgi:hypothetical protein
MTELTGLALHARLANQYAAGARKPFAKPTRARAIDRAVRITFDLLRAKAFMADYGAYGPTSTMCLWTSHLLQIKQNFRRIMNGEGG